MRYAKPEPKTPSQRTAKKASGRTASWLGRSRMSASAAVTAPRPEYVGIQPITIGRETRPSLFQHPPSVVVFTGLVLGRRPLLHLGCGIKEVAWPKLKSAVRFGLMLTDRRGRDHELLQLTVDPAADPVLRPIYPEADLSGAERRLRLFLIQYFGGPTKYSQDRSQSCCESVTLFRIS